jgi:ABC-type dipeptide/oligopeptide/nickel transport system permease subunit
MALATRRPAAPPAPPVRPRSRRQLAARRFRRDPRAVGGLVTLAAMLLLAFAGPLFFPYDQDTLSDTLSAGPGTDGHLLGTDTVGRDLLLRTMRGIQWSMLMVAVFVVVAVTVGVLYGAVAGYRGGRVDDGLMRLLDVLLTVPLLVVVVVLLAAVPTARSPLGVATLIALSSWMSLARVVRAEFLALREREYVEAARALGASGPRIVLRHLLPNALGQVVVWSTVGAAGAIVTEAALSFLGYGVQGSEVSLGRLVADGAAAADSRPWLFYVPGLALLVIVLSISLIGDGLHDATNPTRP